MAEETQVIEKTPITNTVEPVVVNQEPVEKQETADDIIAKVTKKPEPKTAQDNGGTFKEFDDIADPVLRDKMIAREKERIADYTRKTQAVAEKDREVQRQLSEMQTWDEHKIQKYLLNNPSFLQAAQKISSQPSNPIGSGLTDQEFSALLPAEKNQLLQMSGQIKDLQQQNFLSAMSQKDALLQTKYGDYDTLKVNQGIQDLSRMNPIDIREHAYKALFHDAHVQAAYEEGKKYRDNLNTQRTQAVTTPNVVGILPSNEIPTRSKGENDTAYFVKLAQARLAQSRGTAVKK